MFNFMKSRGYFSKNMKILQKRLTVRNSMVHWMKEMLNILILMIDLPLESILFQRINGCNPQPRMHSMILQRRLTVRNTMVHWMTKMLNILIFIIDLPVQGILFQRINECNPQPKMHSMIWCFHGKETDYKRRRMGFGCWYA